MTRSSQSGFTLIEIAIVLLIVVILLGYTVAMFPRQQELKQYRAVNEDMDRIIAAIIGFAQVNGRLPCPSIPNSGGLEDRNVVSGNCNSYGGFVPINTLGLDGRLNQDSLLIDPWGNPYRFYVSNSDFNGNLIGDFVVADEMRDIGLIDSDLDGYLDLDGNYIICDTGGTSNDDLCTGASEVFGDPVGAGGPYKGAPFVLLSQGKNWSDAVAVGDELENIGSSLTNTHLGMANGPSGNQYLLKNVAAGETTFVRRTTGFADDFDDVVRWGSPNLLFSKMIEADQLP